MSELSNKRQCAEIINGLINIGPYYMDGVSTLLELDGYMDCFIINANKAISTAAEGLDYMLACITEEHISNFDVDTLTELMQYIGDVEQDMHTLNSFNELIVDGRWNKLSEKEKISAVRDAYVAIGGICKLAAMDSHKLLITYYDEDNNRISNRHSAFMVSNVIYQISENLDYMMPELINYAHNKALRDSGGYNAQFISRINEFKSTALIIINARNAMDKMFTTGLGCTLQESINLIDETINAICELECLMITYYELDEEKKVGEE